MRALEATAPGKVVHDPVRKGRCGACHGIHGGKNADLLKDAGNDLCRPCHPTFKGKSHHLYGEDYLTLVSGTFKGGFQEAPLPKAAGSAVSSDLIGVDRQNVDRIKPAGLGHFANSRMALRYRLAPSA